MEMDDNDLLETLLQDEMAALFIGGEAEGSDWRNQPNQPMLQQQIQAQKGQLNQQQRDSEQSIQSIVILSHRMKIYRHMLASLDSSSQMESASSGDWQEVIHQKLKSMDVMYYPELHEIYQRLVAKLLQLDAHPQQPKNEQLEKLRFLKLMLERLMMFLRTNKNDIQPDHKEKIVGFEKQIVNILNSNRPGKSVSSLQLGQLTQPHMHAMQQSQQQQPQMHSNGGQMNSQMQPMNMQSCMPAQQNHLTSLQQMFSTQQLKLHEYQQQRLLQKHHHLQRRQLMKQHHQRQQTFLSNNQDTHIACADEQLDQFAATTGN